MVDIESSINSYQTRMSKVVNKTFIGKSWKLKSNWGGCQFCDWETVEVTARGFTVC